MDKRQGWVNVVLLALVLWAAAILPLVFAKSVAAQPQTLGLVAACGSNPACVAVVGAGIVTWCWYTGDCGLSVLSEVRDGVLGWWAADGPGKADMVSQWEAHPGYIVPSGPAMGAWWEAWADLLETGWSYDADFEGLGWPAFWRNVGAPGQPEILTIESLPRYIYPIEGTCTFYWHVAYWYEGPEYGTGVQQSVTLWDANSGYLIKAPYLVSTYDANKKWSMLTSSTTTSCGDVMGRDVKLKVLSGYSGGWTGERLVGKADGYWISLRIRPSLGEDQLYWWGTADFPNIETMAAPAAGIKVNTVQNIDDVIDWNGTTPLPLEGTGYGTVVVPMPGEGTQDTEWWEGLFGGLAGWGEAIWDKLTAVKNGIDTLIEALVSGLASVMAGVQAIPMAIADLFNPAVGWSDFMNTHYPALNGAWLACMPGCLVADLGGLPDLFVGGQGSVDIPFVFETHVAFTPPAEVTTITKSVSVVITSVVVVIWALNRVRKLLGQEGSTSD